jgi:hypothetical protein
MSWCGLVATNNAEKPITGQMSGFSDILKPNPELFKICNLINLSIFVVGVI